MVESIRELREICQKKYKEFRRGYPIWELLDRKISIYFTKLFLCAKITANQATLIATIVGVIATVFLATGPSWCPIIGALLLRLWSILDCTDGEIARYRKTFGVTGGYVDRLNNAVVEPLIFMGLTIRAYDTFNDPLVFIFGFLASISALQIKLAIYETYAAVLDAYFNSEKTENAPEKDLEATNILPHLKGHSSFFYAIVQNFLPGGFIMLSMLLVASVIDFLIPSITFGGFTFNLTYLFLIAYGALLPLGFLGLVFVLLRQRSPEKIYCALISRKQKLNECK